MAYPFRLPKLDESVGDKVRNAEFLIDGFQENRASVRAEMVPGKADRNGLEKSSGNKTDCWGIVTMRKLLGY